MHTHSKMDCSPRRYSRVSSTSRSRPTREVAFVPQIIGIPYFDAMKAGGKEAPPRFGVDFIYQGPVDTNPVDQMQIVQNLIDQGVNAVAVSVLDASSIAPVVEAAKAKAYRAVHLGQRRAEVRPRVVCRASDRRRAWATRSSTRW